MYTLPSSKVFSGGISKKFRLTKERYSRIYIVQRGLPWDINYFASLNSGLLQDRKVMCAQKHLLSVSDWWALL